MKRVTTVAPWLLALVMLAPAKAQSALDLPLRHLVDGQEVAATRLTARPGEIRLAGSSKDGDNELHALLILDPEGRLVRYERDLKNLRDGTILSRVTIVSEGSTLALRERGPMGSRTKSVTGPAVDLVIDAAAPEIFIPFLLDRARKSVRAVLLPELEIKTIVIEDRIDGARYAAVTGGGLTLITDESRAFARLVLPGPEARIVVRAGESRPAPGIQAREERVGLDVGGGVRLGFTLALPLGADGPRPAVVLLGDAGPRDRDGVGGGSLVPTLRLLAHALAAGGVVTIRADKRGSGESSGPDPDLAALVRDARALLDVVALHPAVDSRRIFAAGHGEGAVVAAELGRTAPGIAGVVTLAGPARPLAEALEARLRVRLSAAGQPPEAVDQEVAALRAELAALRALPAGAPMVRGQPLLRDLAGVEPAVQIAALRIPLLIVHGTGDHETPSSQVGLMRASLAFSADRTQFEMVDGADHDLLIAPGYEAIPDAGADVARPLHARIPALILEFIGRTRLAESRPKQR